MSPESCLVDDGQGDMPSCLCIRQHKGINLVIIYLVRGDLCKVHLMPYPPTCLSCSQLPRLSQPVKLVSLWQGDTTCQFTERT